MARLNKRYRKKKRRNPDEGGGGGSSRGFFSGAPLIGEIGEFVVPGFAGFAATRFVTRVAATQIEQRKPTWGKHAGAAASIGSFLAAWLLAHKWGWLRKYQMPIVVGSALAALQSLVQLYIPSMGWLISDASTELDAGTSAQAITSPAISSALPPGMTAVDDDPNLYVYNDSYDAGRYTNPASGNPAAKPTVQQIPDDDLEDLQVGTGIFGQ